VRPAKDEDIVRPSGLTWLRSASPDQRVLRIGGHQFVITRIAVAKGVEYELEIALANGTVRVIYRDSAAECKAWVDAWVDDQFNIWVEENPEAAARMAADAIEWLKARGYVPV
jgi:hypothetical protein